MHQQEVKLKVGKSGSRGAEEFRKEDSPRILVVDDSVETLMLLTDILANNGYKILTASDGHTALKLVEVEVPDLIILDVKMPNMDGYEVCHKLKSDEHSSRIPVIFISGLYDAVNKVKGFNVGGIDYITKPFQLEEVLVRVETHLDLSHLQRQTEEQNIQLEQEITERERAEEDLKRHKDHLEEIVPESVLGLRLLKRGYVAQYDYGKAFLVLEASAESAGGVMQKLRARFGETASAKLADEAFQFTDKYLGKLCIFRKGRYIGGWGNVAEGQDPLALASALAAKVP